jgi:hypothetical protein
MPLSFDSASHGRIAFGFFNIESDLLLLENRFFFADAFCEGISALAGGAAEVEWPGFVIAEPEDVGDLMGAIHGIRHTGFLGATYLRYPFPKRDEDFRQNPEGQRTQAEFREMIRPHAEEMAIRLAVGPGSGVTFAGIRFEAGPFRELVRYVWRGGWPRWKDGRPPPYVLAMRAAIEVVGGPLLGGLRWETSGGRARHGVDKRDPLS